MRITPGVGRLVEPLTLKRGWQWGSCRSVARAKTSGSRCACSRCVRASWTENSALRTQVLASSQSHLSSLGRKMGLSGPGVCLSWWVGPAERKAVLVSVNHSVGPSPPPISCLLTDLDGEREQRPRP